MTILQGVGLWARGGGIPAGDWDFAFVIDGVNFREHIADARARGIEPWLWTGPFHWTPSEWRTTLTHIVQRAREQNVRGIGVDLENGWPEMGSSQRRETFRELGRLLGQVVDSGLEVVVTSFPSLPDIEVLASAAGRGKLIGNAQIYGISAQDGASFQRWMRKWIDSFGQDKATLSFAAEPWGRNAWLRAPGAFRRYLDSLPNVPAAIGWYEGSSISPEYLPQIKAWADSRSWGSFPWKTVILGVIIGIGAAFGRHHL